MCKYQAQFESKDRDGNLWYRYRGHSYCINPNTEWTLREQHKQGQVTIDALIERDEKFKEVKKTVVTEHSSVGLQKWFDYIDDKITENDFEEKK